MSQKLTSNFNEIYNAFQKRSYLYVKSYVHDEMVAEDIVSDSLIRLWERLKKETIYPVEPYLFSILKNSALDHLKHQVIQRDVHGAIAGALERELEIRVASLESSDPKEVFSNEVQNIIDETLQSLPQKTREIFILSRFGNTPHKEIAEKYDITVKGVDYHILQAVKELRISLKDYLPLIGMLPFLKF